MRIDLLLKCLCLAKSRARAKDLCERGSVILNARTARPSMDVKTGDRIILNLPEKKLEIEVVEIPPGQVSRKKAPSYYRLLLQKERGWGNGEDW